MHKWQDISTAPRDGTQILVCRDNGCGWEYDVVWWCKDVHYPWACESGPQYPADRLDYWKPLDTPPYTHDEILNEW